MRSVSDCKDWIRNELLWFSGALVEFRNLHELLGVHFFLWRVFMGMNTKNMDTGNMLHLLTKNKLGVFDELNLQVVFPFRFGYDMSPLCDFVLNENFLCPQFYFCSPRGEIQLASIYKRQYIKALSRSEQGHKHDTLSELTGRCHQNSPPLITG